MASTLSSTISISSSNSFIDKAPRQSPPRCVTLPPPPHLQSQNRSSKATAFCRKLPRNVMPMATGEAPAEVAAITEMPDFKTVQGAWEKVEDKYALTSLGVAGIVALWGSTGLISAIDRLPLVPGVLELVGIGYTGWFAYKNLVFQPDREALVEKIKDKYKDITGSSS